MSDTYRWDTAIETPHPTIQLRILSETKLAINNIFDRVGIHSRAAIAAAAAAGVPVGTIPLNPNAQARIVISGPDSLLPITTAPAPVNASTTTVPTLVPPPNPAAKDMGDNTLKGLAEKLHAIQDRVLDLQRMFYLQSFRWYNAILTVSHVHMRRHRATGGTSNSTGAGGKGKETCHFGRGLNCQNMTERGFAFFVREL